MAVDPRHLQILLDVARSGSFSAAAKLRNVSQPAISLAVAQLENQLGALLLERNRRGVSLTPAGALVVRRAEAIEQHLKAAKAEVALKTVGVSGPLVVGGTPGALATVVPRTIRRMAEGGLRPALRIVEEGPGNVNEMLLTAKIDVAVTTVGLDPVPEGVQEIPLERDEFQVVVAPGDPLQGPDVDLADLVDRPWVLPSVMGSYRRQVDALFFMAEARTPANVVRCDSIATTKELVRTAGYTAIFPRPVMAPDLAGGTLRSLPLRGKPIGRVIGLRLLDPLPSNPLLEAFVSAAGD